MKCPADILPTHDITRSHWLGWSVFLGMSWTWCIGMFLPVLLVNQFGIAGWIVFAIPNVVGAAAMGWVIRSAQDSVAIATSHRIAAQLFSAVTIAFHLYFTISTIAPLAQSMLSSSDCMSLALGCVLVGGALMYLHMTHRGHGDRSLAWTVFVISVVAMGWVMTEIIDISATTPDRIKSLVWYKNGVDLAFLAPICVFGFLACPYLDLTFHRAAQYSNRPRASFGIGFGGFFFAMIICTLLYSRALLSSEGRTPWIIIFLFVHMATQSAFTIAAHARELQQSRGQWSIAIIVMLTFAAWIIYWVTPNGPQIGKLPIGEIIYRIFMGFYGLIFPAYVWLIMLPVGGASGAITIRNLTVFALAVLFALPMFWMGFVVDEMIWLVPGLAVVLLARLGISTGQQIQQNSAPT